ncbi:hypothetical protein G7075_11605 [Phycicoccus sp. HDW14]|uniref:Ig-like domain repeat protein n=1 Tax=Phycicoccus sp. HDW14 TaxID=2714941 RepID=UPI00140C6D40|nr:Ig-like domain repeat protein [Phycicoccus sp. HDW14]QIM21621.1 hypothetical protein G7075_11605 [Phycicoccus sp. HDW14]
MPFPAPLRPRDTAAPRAASSRRVVAAVAVLATAAVGTVLGASRVEAEPLPPQTTTLFAETFAGASTTSPTWFRPSPGGNTACLTGSDDWTQVPIPGCGGDAPGSGVLRLTSTGGGQVGTVFFDSSLPSAQGIDVSFDSYQWAGWSDPADGLSFALAATDPSAPEAPAHAGPAGGALGYVGSPGLDGLPHGYLGVGLDVYGGFSYGAPGSSQCAWNPGMQQTVSVRGPGHGSAGYCVLGSQQSAGTLDQQWSWSRPAPVPVVVSVNPGTTATTNRAGDEVPARSWLVAWTAYGAQRQVMTGALPGAAALEAAQIPSSWVDPETGVPYQLSFGWSGSTGSLAENHAVGNVRATTLTGALPVFGVSVTDDGDGVVDPGATATVTVTPTLDAAGGDESRPAVVTTTVPAGLSVGTPVAPGYDCAVAAQVVTCTTTGSGPWLAGSDLPPISLPLTATGDTTGTATVGAKVSSADGNPAAARHDLVLRAVQELTFAPLASPATIGTSQPIDVTGGGAESPVTVSVDGTSTEGACEVDGDVVRFTGAGSCVLTATQDGDATRAPAAPVSQTVTVEKVVTAVSVAPSSTASVRGEPVTATVSVADGVPGTVGLLVDGQAVGSPVAVGDNGTATLPVTTPSGADLPVGAHTVSATFAPTDTAMYGASTAAPQTVSVDKAATTTAVSVAPSTLTASVVVTAPGRADVTGTVSFSVDGSVVGTAPVVDGVATLAHTTPTDRRRNVSATYSGDAGLLGSAGSTARDNPTVTATVTSASPRSKAGWYRSAVTVTFRCTTNGAPLTAPCPSPVTLSRNGAAQSVVRTVSATDGGVATAAVSGISIDRTAPTARVTGVRAGALYFASTAAARCAGSDALSGVASCRLTRTRSGSTEKITATVTDRAGNVRTASVKVHVTDVTIAGARWKNGVWTVRQGRAYTLLAAGKVRPRYVDAAYAPRAPKGEDNWFVRTGKDRWASGVTMGPSMRTGMWNLGVRRGSTLTVLKVRVVR